MMKNKRGRVCIAPYFNVLLSIKEFMGNNCKVYAEIGCLWGGSICALLSLTNTNTTYIGIDLFSGYYGSNLDKNTINQTGRSAISIKHLTWEHNNIGNININKTNHLQFVHDTITMYNKNKNLFYLVQGSSYDEETVNNVKKISNNIDLLFIDGDHSEKGVKKDFMKYYTFITKNGIIIFDNYGDPNWPGVKKGVDTIDFKNYEFDIVGQFGYSLVIIKL
jgi:hypothetical protein